MAELRWSVQVGQQTLTGTVTNPNGTVRIVCDAPAGTFEKVRAVLPWHMDAEERAFFNGYQTWTYCPEYAKTDRQRGLNHVPKFLVNKFAFDRYGDYHFVDYPNRPGRFHGFSYCYFRRGGSFRFLGSLEERVGYTIFRYDAKKQELTLERDCAGVEWPGGAFHAFDLYFAEGNENQVFDGWFSAMNCKPRTEAPIAGYSSWYNRYENINADGIQADLAGWEQLLKPGDLFQVDDGWEMAVGDWLEPDSAKFPEGMKAVADKIHEKGFRAGLWLAPFVCEENSALFREHPDWLLKVDGKPWKCGCNWSGFYSLDLDHPQVLAYLEKTFERVLGEWGFDLVKLDFLYGAAPFGNSRESRGGRMIRAVELLRKWCGEKLILGCGIPVMPGFGVMDYCRVSCDVSLDWDDVWYMRLFHRERVSTRQAIGNTVFRRQLSGRAYLSDPDVFFLREDNLKLTEQQKQRLAQVCALLGGVHLSSDNPEQYSTKQRQDYERLRKLWEQGRAELSPDGESLEYTLDGQTHRLPLR